MPGFKFFLDGIEVDEPDGFQDFEEELIRDEDKRVIRFDFPLDLTFSGSGYDIIEAKYQAAYNSELQFKVIDSRQPSEYVFIKAVIKLSNCVFNLSALPKHSVKCEIDDSVYQAAIFQNLKRPVGIGGNESLNGVSLTPITPIDLTVFIIIDGSNVSPTRTAYDIKDVFEYVVKFITDDGVAFESSWYDDLPDDQKLCILTGAELRSPTESSIAPIINMQDLFDELWKKYNLYLIIDTPLTNPTIRLEQEPYIYGDAVAIELRDIEGLKRLMDFDRLYNKLVIGSEKFIQELGTDFNMFYLPFLTFIEEEYNITGVINVDRELNLVSKWVIDNNVIADIIENDNDQYDEDVILIQYTASTSTATKGTYFPGDDANARFYNEQLLNSNVANRFSYLGEVVLNSGLLTASFQAGQTVDINASGPFAGFINTTLNPIVDITEYDFQDDSTPPNFDDNGVFTTPLFEAPVAGFNRFKFGLPFLIEFFEPVSGETGSLDFKPIMRFLKNGSEIITPVEYSVLQYDGTETFGNITFKPNSNLGGFSGGGVTAGFGRYIEIQQTILMAEGDTLAAQFYASARLYNSAAPLAAFSVKFYNGVFSNPTTPISGGVYVQNDPDEYYIGIYEIDKVGISDNEWETIKSNVSGIIQIDTGKNDPRKSYISSLKRKLITGETEVRTIFNRKQTFK